MTELLVVDDNEDFYEGLKDGFRKVRPEWRIAFAPGGKAARQALAGARFDVLVTDIDRPGLNARALLADTAKATPHVMRVAVSEQGGNPAARAMVERSHMFLAKPFSMAGLVDMIGWALVVHRFELCRAKPWVDELADRACHIENRGRAGGDYPCIDNRRGRRLGALMVE